MTSYILECGIVRGGTTKGVFLDSRQLPDDRELQNRLLLSLFGSPDTRQVNGLGGGDPLTSKVALIEPSSCPNADIDYLSGEVGIDEATVNYSTMCGNLASGVALFAFTAKMVKAEGSELCVRIRNLNTGKYLSSKLQLEDGVPMMASSDKIDGVGGMGVKVSLCFLTPAGSITGRLLPTQNATDNILLEGKKNLVSIVDCGTLYAFIDAGSLGLEGNESPEYIDSQLYLRGQVESIRDQVAVLISSSLGKQFYSKQVKIAIFNTDVATCDFDVEARVINRYKTHKAYPVSGAICLSAAVMIPGTITYKAHGNHPQQSVKIAHPRGVIETLSHIDARDEIEVISTSVDRSARVIMNGCAVVELE